MKPILIILFFFSLICAHSQIDEEIDSLRRVINKNEISDAERKKTTVRLAKKLKKTDPEEGFKLAANIIESVSEPSNLLVEAYVAAGENQFYLGNKEKVQEYLSKAFEIGKANNFKEGLKEAYKAHFSCFSKFNRSLALEVNKEATDFAEKISDGRFSISMFNNRGIIEYTYKKDIRAAKKWFLKSLEVAEKNNIHERVGGLTMNLGAMSYQDGNYDKSIEYYNQALKAANQTNDFELKGQAYENIGLTKRDMKQSDSAIYYFKLSADEYSELRDSVKMASDYLQIASVYRDRADYKNAIEWTTKALRIYDEYPSTEYYQWRGYRILMNVYSEIGNKEAHYNTVANQLDVAKKLGDSMLLAKAFHYKARYFNTYNDSLSQSLDLLKKAKAIYKLKDAAHKIETLNLSFGTVYLKTDNFQKAKYYFEKALKKYEENPNLYEENIAGTLNNLGVIAYNLGQYDKSIEFYKRALKIRKNRNERRSILSTYETLRNSYEAKKDFENAFKYAKLYTNLKDSIFKKTLSEDLAEMRTKYESEKKEQENQLLQKDNELKSAELEKAALENERNRTMLTGSIAGGILVIFLALVSYRGYLRKRRDNHLLQQKNDEIQFQNKEIKEKNDEIMDSIRYAQRIQETILPANQLIESYFDNSFIFYKPKELVSGDFYWMKSIEEKDGNKLMFSAVDCTGHGVPGAFVSIVGHNGLNRAVNEFELRSPKLVLQKLNDLVVESFAPNEEMSVKDGMDLAFCMIDEKNRLHYSGANNPLWIVSKPDTHIGNRIETDSPDRVRSQQIGNVVLTEVKADKRPIGAFDGENVFTEHSIRLIKGDTVYVFSDGYADQFGGERNKKMKSGKFKKILAESYPQVMSDQQEILKEAFNEWKGGYEQIDDVCVIGYRFEG